jgi:hypothetical protein
VKKISNYLIEARIRARRRKSPWNTLLLFSAIPVWLAVWYGSFELFWRLNVYMYPEHSGYRDQFWTEGISFCPFISSFLMVFGPFFPSVGVALLFSNVLFRVVPPARRALDREALNVRGAAYISAQRGLLKLTLFSLAIGYGLAGIGAFTLSRLH